MKRKDIILLLKKFNYKVDNKDSTCHLWAILCIYTKSPHYNPKKLCPIHNDTRCFCDPRPDFFKENKI